MRKYEVGLSFYGIKETEIIEIPEEDFDGLSPQEAEELVNQYLREFVFNLVDAWAVRKE